MFSKIKDIKHIERDFHSIAWVMPLELDLWAKNLIPSVSLFVMLSPNPLDVIKPNSVCELLTWMGRATALFGSALGALMRGQKVKYH